MYFRCGVASPAGCRFNSTYPKGGVSSSIDSFVVKQTLVFQIKFCGKSPALRVAAKRYKKPLDILASGLEEIGKFYFYHSFTI